MSRPFPDHPFLTGAWQPWPMEGEIDRRAENRSDLIVLDAENLKSGPLATVKLPHRAPAGFRGNRRPA